MLYFVGMEELIRDFINSLDRRPTTKETYRKALIEFGKWLGNTSPLGLASNDIERYKEYINSKHLSSSSMSAYLTAVRRLYDYLEEQGKVGENPAKKVKGGARPKRHSTRALTRKEVDKLFESIDSNSALGIRDSAILNLMVRCGLSEIEIVRANLEDIKHKGPQKIIYVQGKNKDTKDEFVVLPPKAERSINLYLSNRGDSKEDEPLFWGVGNRAIRDRMSTRAIRARVSQCFEKAGLKEKGITPYSLRHTAVILSIESGATVSEVMQMLRVKTINTAQVYFEEAEELKKNKSLDAKTSRGRKKLKM